MVDVYAFSPGKGSLPAPNANRSATSVPAATPSTSRKSFPCRSGPCSHFTHLLPPADPFLSAREHGCTTTASPWPQLRAALPPSSAPGTAGPIPHLHSCSFLFSTTTMGLSTSWSPAYRAGVLGHRDRWSGRWAASHPCFLSLQQRWALLALLPWTTFSCRPA